MSIIEELRTELGHTIATLSPLLPDGHFKPQYYEIDVMPDPVTMSDTSHVSSIFNVTLRHYIVYTFTVTSVNCTGRSPATRIPIQIG